MTDINPGLLILTTGPSSHTSTNKYANQICKPPYPSQFACSGQSGLYPPSTDVFVFPSNSTSTPSPFTSHSIPIAQYTPGPA
ncbi:hypothetical protein ACTXT7_004783 [Hymenolepis weldensis]